MFILNQGLFGFSGPASERAGGARGTGRGHSQGSWPELVKEAFHTMRHHAWYVYLGGLARAGTSDWVGIGRRVVSTCIVHHVFLSSFPSGFYSFPSPFHYNLLSLLLLFFHFHSISIIKLFLSQPSSFTFLSNSPPCPSGWGGSERAALWYLITSWG